MVPPKNALAKVSVTKLRSLRRCLELALEELVLRQVWIDRVILDPWPLRSKRRARSAPQPCQRARPSSHWRSLLPLLLVVVPPVLRRWSAGAQGEEFGKPRSFFNLRLCCACCPLPLWLSLGCLKWLFRNWSVWYLRRWLQIQDYRRKDDWGLRLFKSSSWLPSRKALKVCLIWSVGRRIVRSCSLECGPL